MYLSLYTFYEDNFSKYVHAQTYVTLATVLLNLNFMHVCQYICVPACLLCVKLGVYAH